MSNVNSSLPPFGDLPEDALSAYLDGELTPDARAAVDARLEASPEWRAILAEVRTARDAVRALPVVEPPVGFVDRLLAGVVTADVPPPPDATGVVSADVSPPPGETGVVDLERVRARRTQHRSRWVAALGGAAAAAVVAAVLITPNVNRVKPAVASLTNAHAVRSSAAEDSVSSLASVGKVTGFRR
jgi:anti-sigma factor RsiW